MKTGVCYYPEHWPESRWADDAAHMKRLGLSVVRIGEFAWSRLEDANGTLHFDWLERAIDTLHAAELEVVLGTPTATPPAWLLARHPDMLALDEQGRPRGFGSRRHYCFSSRAYLGECARIVTLLAKRFGQHPGVIAWQTDNEYGCHDTVLSYSDNALAAFRDWCAHRYTDIDALNDAWGNVFWSMEYGSFGELPLPVGAVTESNPAHRLAYWRFATDEVQQFNRMQVDILRAHSPGRDITHNFMGNFVEFDHHTVAADLDIAAWDSYPLGFLARDDADAGDRKAYLRTGTPDNAAFHHDLYRGCCNGRWWVIEQQPGPVNWAPYNPAPLPGMVRYWGWEAFAHGAELMSWFRWRQAPFAQEQMHTGLLLPDGSEDIAAGEVARVNEELPLFADLDTATRTAAVALLFDYASDRAQRTHQPGARAHDPLSFTQDVHATCRRLGVDIDVISASADLSAYKVLLLPTSTLDDADLVDRLRVCAAAGTTIVLFPRTGSKTAEFSIPESLPPGEFRRLIDVRVVRVETLPPTERPQAAMVTTHAWRECIESTLEPTARFDDGWGFHYRDGATHYINAIPDRRGLLALLEPILSRAGLEPCDLGAGLRIRRLGEVTFAFNVGPETVELEGRLPASAGLPASGPLMIGERMLAIGDVAAWSRLASSSHDEAAHDPGQKPPE